MAVNLKAVATLNIKPYMASLEKLAAENAKLNKTVVRGSKAVVDAQKGETAARERGAQQLLKNNNALTNSARQISRSIQQVDRNTAAYGETLGKVNRLSADNIETMSRMTQRQIALRNATESLRAARQRLADVNSVSREADDPTALNAQRALTRSDTAYTKALNARRAEVYANQELAKSERLRSQAMASGTDAAAKQAQTFKSLSNESLNLQRAKDRLAIAEARLASAYTTSNGLITPAVASARRELASAQIGYNNLTEAQKNAGKAGAGVASGLAAQRYLYQDLSRQLAMSSVLTAALPAVAITTAAVWEKQFADVIRTADPLFTSMPNKVAALRESLVGMAQAMPTSFTDVTTIATLANQMGIASVQTADFTRAVAMFTATSGVSVDMAATAFGRLTSILGDNAIGFTDMADAILKVGVNSVATEDEIINVTTQISSIAAQAGFSAKDMIGLSGALASVRVPPELSRGLITRVFGQIDKAVNAGGTGLESLARISGVSAEQFRKDWGSDQSGALFNSFLHGLRDAGSAARSELNNLGITSVRDVPVMLRLANAADSEGNVGELLTQTMRDAENAAGETQRQYEIMADTVAGKLKVLGNNILAFFDAAGQSGLGVFGKLLEKASDGIRNLTNSLDDPHAIFGVFGKTNADVVGWVGSLMLGVSALTLLGSGLAKVWSSLKALNHFSAITGIFGGGKAAGGALGAFAKSGTAAVGTAGALRGALGGVSSFLGGPWLLTIAGGVAALSMLNTQMQKNVTNSDSLATAFASIDTSNLTAVNKELSKITVAGPAEFGGWEMDTKPFANGVNDFQGALSKLEGIRTSNEYHWFGGKQVSEPLQWLDRTISGAWDEVAALEQVDGAIQNLVDGGNGPKAIKLIQSLGGTGKELMGFLESAEGSKTRSFIKNAFNLADLEYTEDNLNRLIRGTIPELTDAMMGVRGLAINAEELFEGDFDRIGDFIEAIDAGAASFLDLGAAMEAGINVDGNGMFESFDLTKWTEALNAQVTAQRDWQSNLSEITKHTSAEVVESLAAMGEAGMPGVQALAEGLKAGTPEAVATLKALEDNLAAGVESMGTSLAEEAANIDWLKGIAETADVSSAILSKFDQVDLSLLREAGLGVGEEVISGILTSLSNGDITLEQAIRELTINQDPIPVHTSFDESAMERSFNGLKVKLADKFNFNVRTELDSGTTIAGLRKIVDDPTLNTMDIDASLTLAEAYAESREFQVWAAEQGIDMFLGADDTAARATLATLTALGNGTITKMQLDALPTLAENAIWQVIETANGETAFVQVDAEDGKAVEGVDAFIFDSEGKRVTIPLTANEREAISKVNSVGEHARKSPANISVYAIDRASAAIDFIARSRTARITVEQIVTSDAKWGAPTWSGGMADGGLVSYYANGGINSKHVAQVAPAGAMRVWAEPETEGEAYIPFARSKRTRSLAILEQVAERFGYGLTNGTNVAKFAEGGFHQLQTRSRYDRMRNSAADSSNISKQINVHIVNPTEKNWSQDALDSIQQFGGALDV